MWIRNVIKLEEGGNGFSKIGKSGSSMMIDGKV